MASAIDNQTTAVRTSRRKPVRRGSPALSRWWRAVGWVLAAVGAMVVVLARTGGHGSWDTLWAEDASDFVSDAYNRPTWATLWTPINGYFLLIARLMAEPVTVVPVDWAAAVIAVEVAAATVVLAFVVYAASGAHTRSVPVRLLFAVPLVIAPVGQGGLAPGLAGSVVGNLATFQFPLCYALFWVLLWTPATRPARVAVVSGVAATALSTMLAALYLPLVWGRVVRRRDRHSVALAVTLSLGAAVQVVALSTGYAVRDVGRPRLDLPWATVEYLRWLLPNAILGERWWQVADPAGQIWLAIGAGVAVAVAAGVAAARLTDPLWSIAALAFGYSVGFAAFELLSFGYAADRYLYLPGLLLFAALVAVVRPRGDHSRRQRGRHRVVAWIPFGTVVVVYVAVCAVNLQVPNQRARGFSWQSEVHSARLVCARGRAATVQVRTHPARRWDATIGCAKLR